MLALSILGWANDRPNVVIIYADDLGYGDVGCYGATKVRTPNIDQLAETGRRFTDGHSASSVCSPSRYALLTGEYPYKAKGGRGLWGPCAWWLPLQIDTNKTTIADVFQDQGYATACIGKWHLGFGDKAGKGFKDSIDWNQPLRPGPQDLGFDYYFGMPIVNSNPPYVYVENETIVGLDSADPLLMREPGEPDDLPMPTLPPEASGRYPNFYKGAKKARSLFIEEEVATKFTEKSVEWINQHKEEPFFLYLATTNIHHPFTPHPRFKGTSDIGLYGDAIHELDWMVGEIVNALDVNGLTENTLIIFTSDNGGMFNRGGQDAWKAGHAQNGELLGYKFGVWEGGHRVPFIAKWPKAIPAGSVSDQLIANVDLLATMAAITGQTLTKEQSSDSENLLEVLTGTPTEEVRGPLILCPSKGTHLSLRHGKWVYIPNQGGGGWDSSEGHVFSGPPAISFMGRKNSDIENGAIKPNAPAAQLYNVDSDLAQTENLYLTFPDKVAEMKETLKRIK